MQVTNIREVVKTHKSILNWGPPITGKTFCLWTLVKWLKEKNLGPLHLFDIDSKCESLVLKLDEEKLLDHLVVYQYRPARDKMTGSAQPGKDKEVYLELMSDVNKLYDIVDPRTRTWTDNQGPGAICIDSLTALNKVIIEFTMASLGHDLSDKGTDARKDYNQIMNKITEALDSVKHLPCINVINAHEQYSKDDTLGKIMCLPKVTGKDSLAPSLAGRFNVVVFSDLQKEGDKWKYIWYTKPEPTKFIRSAGMTSRVDFPPIIAQDYRGVL